MSVLTIGPSGKARIYSSLRAASRVLSGDGSDRRRSLIAERIENGGGRVASVWVQGTTLRGTRRR
jgi:hypothetical protein